MRGRGERSRIEELEDQVLTLRMLARGLWRGLRARTGIEAETLVRGGDIDQALRRVDDIAYDVAETVWQRHHVSIMPCRQVLERADRIVGSAYPTQSEAYVGKWPDGSTRNLTRDQLLMMAGLDPEEPEA